MRVRNRLTLANLAIQDPNLPVQNFGVPMHVDLVSLEVVSVGKALLTEVADVFGRDRGLRHGDRYGLNLLHDLPVLHHVTDNDLLRLLLGLLRNLLLNLSSGLLLRLLLNDRVLRLLLLREKYKEKRYISTRGKKLISQM